MPELPEVETIKLQLEKYLVGHKIKDVEIRYGKKFEGNEKKLIGGKIIRIRRFGKAQSIDLDNGYSIVVHIKLTGQLIYRGPNLPHFAQGYEGLSKKVLGGLGGKHTHVVFELSSKGRSTSGRDKDGVLYYNDVRKFGWIKVVETEKVTETEFIGKLGPEPLVTRSSSEQAVLTLDLFKKILSETGRPTKVVLMDQEKISGVGNIYANDALFLARINPRRSAAGLNRSEVRDLYNAILDVLKKGLKYGGASELAYVTPDGSEGSYQDHTLVYGREGEPCLNKCGEIIKKIKLAGRGTYFCPVCQI